MRSSEDATPRVRFDTTVQFREHPDIVQQLDRAAFVQGLRRTDLLRRAVREYLHQFPREPREPVEAIR